MKIVQLNGGPLGEFKLYVGPERELTAETTNDELRLHDGSTPGGVRFLNLTQNDQRYQAKQAELDGFNFGANAKGFVVRVSPGVYRLRQLTVDTDNLSLTNPLGLLANPQFSLAANIVSDHSFAGLITFDQEVTAPTFLGNLTGNVEGNVTGNLTGNVTGNLTGNTTGLHTGDVDVQGAQLLMDPGQIQLAWLSAEIQNLWITWGVPPGGIIFWAGTELDVPDTWALCDGNNGTPNLSGFFIRASGPGFAPHSGGGNLTHTHTMNLTGGTHVHNVEVADHVLTVDEIPNHRHLNGVVDKNDNLFNHGGAAAVPTMGDSIDGNSSNGTREGYTTYVGGGAAHTHAGSVTPSGEGGHTHSGNTGSASNDPVYYALAIIMKVG